MYLSGALPYVAERDPLMLRTTLPRLAEQHGSVFLVWDSPPEFAGAATQLVTSELLGKTAVSELGFDNHDGAALRIDADYTGRARNATRPWPGLFEQIDGKIQVWR